MKKAIVCALAALALVAFAQPLEERPKRGLPQTGGTSRMRPA